MQAKKKYSDQDSKIMKGIQKIEKEAFNVNPAARSIPITFSDLEPNHH